MVLRAAAACFPRTPQKKYLLINPMILGYAKTSLHEYSAFIAVSNFDRFNHRQHLVRSGHGGGFFTP